jgi:hypothetical protein
MKCSTRRSLMASLLVLATFSLKDAAAQSGPLTTTEATALLARIHAIDIKCQVLSASDSDDLYQLLLSAEVLLAKKTSLKEAQRAVADGKAAAARCTCDDADQGLVVSTFALARVAGTPVIENPDSASALDADEALTVRPEAFLTREPPVAQVVPPLKARAATKAPNARSMLPQKIKPAPQAPVSKPAAEQKIKSAPKTFGSKSVPRPQIKPPQLSENVQKKKIEVPRAPEAQNANATSHASNPQDYANLMQYAGLAQRYYTVLKCRSMSYEKIKRLYATVVVSHKAAVAEYKRSDIRAMLSAAKARADIANCS